MKAMILAAGLGTRLRPLTSNIPKALVPVGNRPVIDRVIQYLKKQGVSEIVVNAHHHHQQIVKHLNCGRPFGIDIDVRVEPEILGTGGGIKNTEDFWDADPFIVINSDIITDIDLAEACKAHKKGDNLATLALHDYEPFNQIRIDDRLNIMDIARENRSGRLAFTGIHIIEPGLLAHIKGGVYSNIIDYYRELIKSGKPIRAHVSAVIGEKAILEHDVEVRRSILWKNVKVKRGIKVIDSIVTASREVVTDLIDEIL
ncbi:MAG: nucleotidyltransferase family protein [Deltaproteobacteria bacterium]|nr:nucleotidyltransferase family protein [Deltaproteobacteria bacterium]